MRRPQPISHFTEYCATKYDVAASVLVEPGMRFGISRAGAARRPVGELIAAVARPGYGAFSLPQQTEVPGLVKATLTGPRVFSSRAISRVW
jgi:hypothetical protein